MEGRRQRLVRLRHRTDFERVRALGQSWRHPLLILLVCQNDQTVSRIGVIAGRKMGGAVERNRARRLLREAARLAYDRLAPGWDIVLIARRAIGAAKSQQVYSALIELARRAGLVTG